MRKPETEEQRIARLDREAMRNYRTHRGSMRNPSYRAKMRHDDDMQRRQPAQDAESIPEGSVCTSKDDS